MELLNSVNVRGLTVQTAALSRGTKNVADVIKWGMFLSLFVCLPATLRKNFRTDLHEIFTDSGPVT